MNPAPNNSSSEFSGQAPDQPPVSNVPQVPPAAPAPATPAASSPIPPPPATPPVSTPPPAAPPAAASVAAGSSPHKGFPFMMVTLFVVVVLAGFAGSYVFFSMNSNKTAKAPAKLVITPPMASPTQGTANPFATAAGTLGSNPFASPTAVTNPFGTYQNPFTNSTVSATPATYQNPFNK